MDENRMQCEEQIELEKKSKRPKASIIILSILILVLSVSCAVLVIELNSATELSAYYCFCPGVDVRRIFTYEAGYSRSYEIKSKVGEEITVKVGSKSFTGTYLNTYEAMLGSKYEERYTCSDVIPISEIYPTQLHLRSDGSIAYIGEFEIEKFDFSLNATQNKYIYELAISNEELELLLLEYYKEDFNLSYYDKFVVSKPEEKNRYDCKDPLTDVIPSTKQIVAVRFEKTISDSLELEYGSEYIEFRFVFDTETGCNEATLYSITYRNPFDDPNTAAQEHFGDRNINLPSPQTLNTLVERAVEKQIGGEVRIKCGVDIKNLKVSINTLDGMPFLKVYISYKKSDDNNYSLYPYFAIILLGEYE